MNAPILALVALICWMVNFYSTLFNVKIVEDQSRSYESVNVDIGVEDDPRTGEITAYAFNVVRIQGALLLEPRP